MITNRTYGMDADVISYNARIVAGGNQSLSMQSLRQLNQFVISIKKMNLWDKIIFWPLRANQNAGTGATAYSLGGLATANAILSGGNWLYDGYSMSSTEYASATLPSQSQDLSLILVAAGNGTAYSSFPQTMSVARSTDWSNNEYAMGSNGGSTDFATFVRNSANSAFVGGTITNSLSNATAFTCLASSFKLGNLLTSKNYLTGATTSVSAPTTGTSTLNRMQLNGRWNGSLALANPMKAAFTAVFAPAIFSTMDQVYALYKSTLGQDLGLP